MCHPAAEAFAGVVADVPIKLATAISFNTILYFWEVFERPQDLSSYAFSLALWSTLQCLSPLELLELLQSPFHKP